MHYQDYEDIFSLQKIDSYVNVFKREEKFMNFGKLILFFFFIPTPLFASETGLPGHELTLWWALPFIGVLGSLALLPLFAKHFWESHYGKVAFGWAFISISCLLVFYGLFAGGVEILATFFHHYLPFIIILGVLYTISGGIHIDIQSHSTPLVNTTIMAIGTFLAGWIGTTGASMLLIRPFIHINRNRQNRIHHMIFFIFLISNVGGVLTPLGDPPLFLGFLNGVSFFWTLKYLMPQLLIVAIPLLLVFYALDSFIVRKEGHIFYHTWPKVRLKGTFNGLFFFCVIGLVLLSGLWNPNMSFKLGGVVFEFQNLVRDIGLIGLAFLSWYLTPKEIYRANHFSWEPFKEIVKLFFGIFMTVIPVVAILNAGQKGALEPLISLVSHEGVPQNAMYFWLSGALSSFLDNAPTYLVFFHMAGGDATILMTTLRQTLEAISLGSVFLGAMTYIGNAPNFMVKAIAESHKIPMPTFFGYMVWSLGILLPLFILLAWLWF